MKKNIVIVILSIIVVILICKAMFPTVVTERRINLRNRYSDTSLSENSNKNINHTVLKQEQFEEYSDNDEDNEYFEEEDYVDYPQQGKKTFWDKLNEPIRFPKSDVLNQKIDLNKKITTNNIEQEENVTEENRNEELNQKLNNRSDSFSSNLKICKPYKEVMDSEYMGIKIKYEIEILGWVNNKCTLNFKSKMTGVDESFKDMYGIDPSDATISAFTPNIRCEFTKTQLLYIGDSALQENERNNGATNNMLKNPNDIVFPDFQDMSIEDAKLLQVVFGNQACKMLNIEELKSILNSALDF